jgi:Na+-transporting NADH:ubiquinone oxidoreductase subunit F
MLTQIAIPIVVSTGVVLALCAFVLAARRQLVPTGIVAIDVNGQRVLEVNAGARLLWTLAESGIYLPAACGGRGTCGQCRVTVTSGGGSPLPTELVHIRAAEAAAGVRLACMLRVREAMSISVPRSVLEVRRWVCTVVSNRNVSTYMKELVLRLPDAERIRFHAGDYVLLDAPAHRLKFRDFDIDAAFMDEWRRQRLFDLESVAREASTRAYSLANPPQEDDRLVLVVRIATPPPSAPPACPPGRVSSYIFGLKPGDSASIAGPFGEFHVADSSAEIVFIAGGAGIAPIRSMVLDQLSRGSGRKMSFWYGSRDIQDLCYEEEFERAAEQNETFEFHVALSMPRDREAWRGHTGFIHSVVYERYLKSHPAPRELEYYLCGPPVMSSAVIQMLEGLGVERRNIFFDDFGA